MNTAMIDKRRRMDRCDFEESLKRTMGNIRKMTDCEKCTTRRRTGLSQRTFQFLFLVLWTALTQNCAVGFNLDVKFPTLVTIPDKNSYFGFSVDMYASNDESWLLVGAPKSRTRGDVFTCRYEDNVQHNCTRIELTKDSPATTKVPDMFGATLYAGPEGKELLICAPYFTEETVVPRGGEQFDTYYDILGVCYFMESFMDADTSVFKLIPCRGSKGNHHDGDSHGSCEVGMSAAFTKDGKHLVLGAAGSYYRQGSIMLMNLPIENDVTRLPLHTGESQPEIPEGWKKSFYLQQSVDENYAGYAVATGRSIKDTQLLFVGAPRRYGYDLLGMVIVYDQTIDFALHNFTGNQTGEYYGSAIASTDLNNDGLDDLIVGAPLYSDPGRKLFESGRIYVYYQIGAVIDEEEDVFPILKLNFSEPIVIKGTKGRARFGNSITAIGDINQDGYADIAVGAPYAVNDESGESDGSLFIFNGGPEGLIIPASQEIKGVTLDDSLKAFGYSSAGNKDVDRNGYPDVIAGAYLSGRSVLLRSRPVVEITSHVMTDPQVIDIEVPSCSASSENTATTSCFTIKTCFSYTGKSVPPSIQLGYTYDIDAGKSGNDKRAFILDDITPRNLTLVRESSRASQTKCVEEVAYFNIDIRDKLSPIIVKVSHTLIDREQPVEPVLNELKPPYTTAVVTIFKDCGDDDICQADLRVDSSLDTGMLYAGKAWPVVLEESIQNLGEPAFLSTLVVEFPKEVSYVGTQDKEDTTGVTPFCTNVDQVVACEVGNPMKRDAKVNVNLKFQTLTLDGNYSSLTFKSFVNSTNPTNNTSETKAAALSIGVRSDITMYNTSYPDAIYLKDSDRETKSSLAKNLTTIKHTYEIINKGPSKFSAGTIYMRWPLKTVDGLSLLELVQIIENKKAISCGPVEIQKPDNLENTTDDANFFYCDGRAQCASIACEVNRGFAEATITAEFELPLKTVIQDAKNSFIKSELTFEIKEYPYTISSGHSQTFSSEITTSCLYVRQPAPKEVQWWIIAIAVSAGLLFLLLIVFILWRCRFFERKRKPEGAEQSEQKQHLNPKSGPDDDAEEMEQYLK